jgi:RNA polymerase sigma-70 factor, ECF subfamily
VLVSSDRAVTSALLTAVFHFRDADDFSDASHFGARDPRASQRDREHAIAHAMSERADAGQRTTDHETVARIRAGDIAAYETVFRAYFSTLSDFAESIVDSSDSAEELVQTVLWRIWERRAEWTVHESIRAYLFTAVRYQALNHVRNQRHRGHLLARAARQAGLESGQGSATSPVHQSEVADLAEHLRRAIAALPAARRQVLTLRWDHGLSYAEIAAVVGSSVKAVEHQLNRTLKQLREQLAHLAPNDRRDNRRRDEGGIL